MSNRFVYLDHSATTPVKPEVWEEMAPYFSRKFGNASSVYSIGRESRAAVEAARARVARALGADDKEIYFTSGGTESDNWALKGVAYTNRKKGSHIITTSIEHHAILNICDYLAKEGIEITYLPVDKRGLVDPRQVEEAIRPETILISVMFANNEIGTIQPVKAIGEIARSKGIYFHTDAVQAVGNVRIDVEDMNIDMLSLSAHKFYGPKGTGVLYIRKGVEISSLMQGGSHEMGRRAGTENVPGIVGLGKAIELADSQLEEHNGRLLKMRERLIDGILEQVPFVRFNGDREKRLPGNANITFQYVEGESILLMLDMKGIAVSTGSACASGSLDPSHVLLALGMSHEEAHGSIRMTLGDDNTDEDIDYVLETLPPVIERLRKMSPLYEEIEKGARHV